MSVDRLMSKANAVHVYTPWILLSHEEEWSNSICGYMYGSTNYYAEWSKSDEDKYLLLTYM